MSFLRFLAGFRALVEENVKASVKNIATSTIMTNVSVNCSPHTGFPYNSHLPLA